VSEVLNRENKAWTFRATKYDLDRDGDAEYFVPTICDRTGPCCEWEVFRQSPRTALGQLIGSRVYISDKGRWPRITTYDRFDLGQAVIREYEFRSGKYVEVVKKAIDDEENQGFIERMGVPTRPGR
jgi:hypothetical protein